jgi:LSD1 subclass zinc finger protein
MKPLLLLCFLFSTAAWADDMLSVAVSNTTPTNVTASSTCGTCRSILVTNRGTNTIYCSPESDVTTSTGVPLATDDPTPFPYVAPLYCIAATAAQAGTGTDRTLVWVSQS